jgi:hypothetical protein
MRRVLAPLLLAALLILLPAGIAGAVAAPAHVGAHQALARGSCPNAPSYPPAPDATVEVNTTVPSVGDPLEISGIRYCPNESVELTIAGQHVGTAHTDGDGGFDPQVTTPGPPGAKQVCGIGASGLDTDRDCLLIHVQNAGSSAAEAGPPAQGNGGGTAFTGVQIALLGVLALVLVVGGVVVTTVGRNRRPERA